MPSQVVILCLHSAERAKSQLGRHGMSCYPTDVEEDDTVMLKKFVVTMYDRSSSTVAVDNARLELSARKQRSYDAIPPTRAALVQHIRRATSSEARLEACIWSRALVCQPEEDSPAEWGWKQERDCWSILWSALPPVAESCKQLTKCQCKTQCRGRCKCYKFGLSCTAMCSCTCSDSE